MVRLSVCALLCLACSAVHAEFDAAKVGLVHVNKTYVLSQGKMGLGLVLPEGAAAGGDLPVQPALALSEECPECKGSSVFERVGASMRNVVTLKTAGVIVVVCASVASMPEWMHAL